MWKWISIGLVVGTGAWVSILMASLVGRSAHEDVPSERLARALRVMGLFEISVAIFITTMGAWTNAIMGYVLGVGMILASKFYPWSDRSPRD